MHGAALARGGSGTILSCVFPSPSPVLTRPFVSGVGGVQLHLLCVRSNGHREDLHPNRRPQLRGELGGGDLDSNCVCVGPSPARPCGWHRVRVVARVVQSPNCAVLYAVGHTYWGRAPNDCAFGCGLFSCFVGITCWYYSPVHPHRVR
jgi:hypothetical protein